MRIWMEIATKTLHFGRGSHISNRLAFKSEFMSADRCVGSIFEGLEPGQQVELYEGFFLLDNNLDPVEM